MPDVAETPETTFTIEFPDGASATCTEEAARKLQADLKQGDAGLSADLAAFLRMQFAEFFVD